MNKYIFLSFTSITCYYLYKKNNNKLLDNKLLNNVKKFININNISNIFKKKSKQNNINYIVVNKTCQCHNCLKT